MSEVYPPSSEDEARKLFKTAFNANQLGRIESCRAMLEALPAVMVPRVALLALDRKKEWLTLPPGPAKERAHQHADQCWNDLPGHWK